MKRAGWKSLERRAAWARMRAGCRTRLDLDAMLRLFAAEALDAAAVEARVCVCACARV